MIKKSFKTILCLSIFLILAQTVFALNIVKLSPGYYPNTSKGKPLASADIYVGIPDLDPEIVGNQRALSVQQEDGTIVAVSQPIHTNAGGVPVYAGSPVTLLVEGDYSLKVLDSNGNQIYYVPSTAYEQYLVAGNYYYPDYTETDQGVAGGGETVTDILTEVGITERATMYFSHNSGGNTTTYTFTTNTTITDNLNVIIEEGVILDGAGQLTISGPFRFNQRKQVFGSSITVLFGYYKTVFPEWWGAVGDGTTDDRTEIQACFDSLSTAGGLVNITHVHYVSDYVAVKCSNVTLYGNGRKGSLKNVTNTNDILVVAQGGLNAASTQLTDITLKELKIEGHHTSYASANWNVMCANIQRLTVKDCFFYYGGMHLNVSDSVDVEIEGNTCEYTVAHNAINIGDCHRTRIYGNSCKYIGNTSGQAGVAINTGVPYPIYSSTRSQSQDITITGNTILGNSALADGTTVQMGIAIEDSAQDVVIADNTITDCGRGIYLYMTTNYASHVLNWTIDNNIINDALHGIAFSNQDTVSDWSNIKIISNQVYECSGNGIDFNSATQNTTTTGVQINKNFVTKCGSHGIAVYDVEGFQINDNVCIDNGEDTGTEYNNMDLRVLDTGMIKGNICSSINSGGSALLNYNMYVAVGNTNNTVKVENNITVPKGSDNYTLKNYENQARCRGNVTHYSGYTKEDPYQLTADLTVDATWSGVSFFSDDPNAAQRTVTLADVSDTMNLFQYDGSDIVYFIFHAWDQVIRIDPNIAQRIHGDTGTGAVGEYLDVNVNSSIRLWRGPDNYWVYEVIYGTVTHEP